MSTAKRVIKNTGFLYAKMGITMFISLYTTRLVLNALGASDFGIFSVVGGAIAMLSFLNAAMSSATQRFMSYAEGEGNKEKQKTIFNISFVLHFVIAIILILVLIIAGYFFFNGILNIQASRIFAAKVVYSSLIISTAFTVMSVPYEAVLNARENMLYYAIVGIIESILKLAVALAVVYFAGDKLIIYGILMACIPLIILTIMRIYCHSKYEECIIAPKKFWDKKMMKEMSSFAGWNLMGSTADFATNYGRSIVANNYFGNIVNAALGIVGQISGQLLSFSSNMMKAINPIMIKKEASGNRKDLIRISFTASKLSFLMFAIFALPLYIEASYILKLWLINVPQYTEIFLKIFIFQVLVEQVSLPLSTVLAATGKIKQYKIWNTIIMLASLLSMWILFASGYSAYSLMIISLISAVFLMITRVIYCNLFSELSIFSYLTKVFLPCSILTIIVLLFTHFTKIYLPEPSIIRLIAMFSICIMIFTISLFTYLLSSNEKEIITGLITKINPFKKGR